VLKLSRRAFLASLPLIPGSLARAAAPGALPQNRNVKWSLSLALWKYYPPSDFTAILDVMQQTGFTGIRLTSYPLFLLQYHLKPEQLRDELAQRGLHGVSISWNGPLQDPSRRQECLASAKSAIQFLAGLGANHLVVFSPDRTRPGANTAEGYRSLYERCNEIGRIARDLGFTAGLHNHWGQMVQNADEIDRFLAAVDPALFGFSPDTAHLNLAGCDVVGTLEKHKHRIRFLDYKDSRWTAPAADLVQPNGKVLKRDSGEARFFSSIYDLGDGQVDFPGCHRVLRSVQYRGWICVDLDRTRQGPLASYRHCDAYITKRLEPIYV